MLIVHWALLETRLEWRGNGRGSTQVEIRHKGACAESQPVRIDGNKKGIIVPRRVCADKQISAR